MPAAQSALNVAVRRCLTAIRSWQISEPPHGPRIRGPGVERQRWLARRASQEVACEGHGTRGQGPGDGGKKKRAQYPIWNLSETRSHDVLAYFAFAAEDRGRRRLRPLDLMHSREDRRNLNYMNGIPERNRRDASGTSSTRCACPSLRRLPSGSGLLICVAYSGLAPRSAPVSIFPGQSRTSNGDYVSNVLAYRDPVYDGQGREPRTLAVA
jgi:hypothetical protein